LSAIKTSDACGKTGQKLTAKHGRCNTPSASGILAGPYVEKADKKTRHRPQMTGANSRCLIALACIFWSGASMAADGDLARLDGRTEIRRFGGTWQQARTGDRLSPGDRVRTSEAGGVIVILPGGWTVELGAFTSMELNESLPPDYPATVALLEGSARALLIRPETGHPRGFEVYTASGPVRFSEGDAAIFIAHNGSVRAVPEDGAISAGSGGNIVEVRSGQSIEISPGAGAATARSCPSCTDEWKETQLSSLRNGLKQNMDALAAGIRLSCDGLDKALDELSAAERDVTDLVDRMKKARKNKDKERDDLRKAALVKFAGLWKNAGDVQAARNAINTSAAAIRTIFLSMPLIAPDGGTPAVKEPPVPGMLEDDATRLKKLRTGFRSVFHERIGEFMDVFDGLMP
jgi:hypothetical protein